MSGYKLFMLFWSSFNQVRLWSPENAWDSTHSSLHPLSSAQKNNVYGMFKIQVNDALLQNKIVSFFPHKQYTIRITNLILLENLDKWMQSFWASLLDFLIIEVLVIVVSASLLRLVLRLSCCTSNPVYPDSITACI